MSSNASIKTKKRISLKKIFSEYSYNDNMWLDLIKKNYEPEAQFLYLLAPCITYINEKIGNIKIKNYKITEEDRQNIILKKFKDHWLQKIMMCCVLELNDAKELKLLIGETPEKRFESFIELLADNNNRVAFFDKYVVLKEKLQRYLIQEVEALTEILTRLDKCFDDICINFCWKEEKYVLKNLHSSGDSHGSRNVCILVLSDGKGQTKKIVYKPRSLLMDKAYHEFLTWLNSYLKFPLYNPKLLLKKEYGWCEFIQNLPCKNIKQIQEYYQNLGNLLAVVYLLCGSDIHYENIISYGKHPVIIDLECLFVPHNILKNELMSFLDKMYSVLNTLILPCRVLVNKNGEGIDISGFTNHANQEVPYQTIVAESSGTDNVRLIRKKLTTARQNNVPSILNKQVHPIKYIKYVKIGFNESYSVFLKNKKCLSSQKNPLLYFKQVRTRLVFRPTSEYAKLLIESYHPVLLTKKSKYRKHFSEWLNKNRALEFLYESEIEQILQGDIPAFYITVNSKNKLEDARLSKIHAKFSISGYSQVINHIKNNINKNDLKIQNIIIEQSFLCYKKNINILQSRKLSLSQKKEITNKIVLNNIKCLLNEIEDHAWFRSNFISWPQSYLIGNSWNVGITSPWMYDGLSGIALIFGLSYDMLKIKKYHKFTTRCIKVIELHIKNIDSKNINIPIGAFSGIGSVLYLIQVLSKKQIKYDFDELKNKCFLLLEKYIFSIKSIVINELDVISGMAGLLKILVNFSETTDEIRAFSLANICARHILETYPIPSIFPKKNKKSDNLKKPLLGFSHGVSGIAWALYHYYLKVKKIKKIYAWIENALKYERSCFSEKYQNWPHFGDAVSPEKPESIYPVKWCHGAVGIGFSRVDMYRNGWRDKYILGEINSAIQTTLSTSITKDMNLCHGALCNLEFLKFSELNGFLTKKDYCNYFDNLVSYIIDSKKIITQGHEKLFSPGLMVGKAGIVYELIKIADFNLPSVLLLDKINL